MPRSAWCTSPLRRGLAVGVVLLVLSGCGGTGAGSGGGTGAGSGGATGAGSRPRFDAVMKDPRATADEIIASAGPPDEIARTADGSLLVLWRPFIDLETDTSPIQGATAWRLYDAQGHAVRTYSSPDLETLSVTATADGFLLTHTLDNNLTKASLVDPGGEQHPVPADRRHVATRAGDTFVAGEPVQRVYRPADHTLHELLRQPGYPRDVLQWYDALLDARGALWIQGYEGPHHWVGWSRDGGRTLHEETLPLQRPGATTSMPRMAVASGVTAVLSDQVNGDEGGAAGPGYLDVVFGYGRRVHRVTAATFPFLDRVSVDPDLSVTTDGRVLLGDRDADQWWIATDQSNVEFERLDTPKHVAFVKDLGGTLFAWGNYEHRDATLQTSTDDGATWTTYDVIARSG